MLSSILLEWSLEAVVPGSYVLDLGPGMPVACIAWVAPSAINVACLLLRISIVQVQAAGNGSIDGLRIRGSYRSTVERRVLL